MYLPMGSPPASTFPAWLSCRCHLAPACQTPGPALLQDWVDLRHTVFQNFWWDRWWRELFPSWVVVGCYVLKVISSINFGLNTDYWLPLTGLVYLNSVLFLLLFIVIRFSHEVFQLAGNFAVPIEWTEKFSHLVGLHAPHDIQYI